MANMELEACEEGGGFGMHIFPAMGGFGNRIFEGD